MPNIAVDTLELVALSLTPGLGPIRARRLLDQLGSAKAIFAASQRELESAEGIGSGVSAGIVKHRGKALDRAGKEIQKAEQIGARVITRGDEEYPAIVVLGCGLGHCYPPENLGLFDAIVDGGHGAVVSELPCDSPPEARNFPARNRLISGMSLGVLVIEAGRKSGALITARQAAEDHGREVYALPGRVDSEVCEGSLELLKSGGAQLVTQPSDIVDGLEAPAWHAHGGTHEARYTPERAGQSEAGASSIPGGEAGRLVFEACAEPRTPDQIGQATGLEMSAIGQAVTMLEISGLVRRAGSRIERVR